MSVVTSLTARSDRRRRDTVWPDRKWGTRDGDVVVDKGNEITRERESGEVWWIELKRRES